MGLKNKIVGISTLVLSSIVIPACASSESVPSPYDEVNTFEGVSIEFEKNEYETEGENFFLTTINDSEDAISYGIAFTLEKEENGEWFIVEPEEDMAFILIAHILNPGDEAQEELNMEYYEPFDAAHYRIIREIEGEVLAAEFEVK